MAVPCVAADQSGASYRAGASRLNAPPGFFGRRRLVDRVEWP
jgi:hypothetical protein